MCDRVLEGVPGEYASKSECITDAAQVVSCETAVSVTANYGPCVGELKSAACSTLFPAGALDLPSICSQVIQTQ